MCAIIEGCISIIMAREALRWATSSLMTAAIGLSIASTALDSLAAFISATSLSRVASMAWSFSCISLCLAIMASHSFIMSVWCAAFVEWCMGWPVMGAAGELLVAGGGAAGAGVCAP